MFINEFITKGLNDYFGEQKAYSFERHIIECLGNIYGLENMKMLYASKDQNTFIQLIRIHIIK